MLLDFPVAQMVKSLPEMQETRVRSLGWEVPLEKVIVKSLSCVRLFATPWTVARPGSSVHGDFLGKNTLGANACGQAQARHWMKLPDGNVLKGFREAIPNFWQEARALTTGLR